MACTKVTLLLAILLISPMTAQGYSMRGLFLAAAAGGAAVVLAPVATVVLAPVAVVTVGFGSGGIAAGSLAAATISTASTTGFGMAAALSVIQSIGAAGMGVSQMAAVGATVAGTVYGAAQIRG